MANIIDERTPNLGLPLPHVKNDQVDDVERLRTSFGVVDDACGSLRMETFDIRKIAQGAEKSLTGIRDENALTLEKVRQENSETLQAIRKEVGEDLAAALARSAMSAWTYAERAALRSIANAKQDDMAVILGLGLFGFVPDSQEPDDDETAFAAPGGVWELQAVSLDVAYSYIGREFARQTWFRAVDIRPTITSLAANTHMTINFDGHVGIEAGDRLLASPPADADPRIMVQAFSDYWRRISLKFCNLCASTLTVSQQPWRVYAMYSGDNHA